MRRGYAGEARVSGTGAIVLLAPLLLVSLGPSATPCGVWWGAALTMCIRCVQAKEFIRGYSGQLLLGRGKSQQALL